MMREHTMGTPDAVQVQATQDDRGRGLVSTQHVRANDIILSCPCIEDETVAFQNSVTIDYVFEHPKKTGNSVLPLGMCALANHSDDPNSTWDFHETQSPPLMYIRAIRPIQPGEEVLLNYGESYWSSRPQIQKK